MAISDADLSNEITTDPLGLGYAGAGAQAIHQKMTKEGSASTQTWIVSPTPKPIGKGKFLQQISSIEENAFFKRTRNSGSLIGDAMDFKLSETSGIDMSFPDTRNFVMALTATDDIPKLDAPLKAASRDAILRLGEVLQSRAQELWGENPTIEQIKGVL